MDHRYHQLRATLAYEGITPAEYAFGMDYFEAPAHQAANLSLLLRGVLSERGSLLDNLKSARMAGVAAGRVLVSGLLANNSQCLAQPQAPLSEPEWARGREALAAESLTCEQVLNMLTQTKAVIRYRQLTSQAA